MGGFSKGSKVIRRVSKKLLLVRRSNSTSANRVEEKDGKKDIPELEAAKTWEDDSFTEEVAESNEAIQAAFKTPPADVKSSAQDSLTSDVTAQTEEVTDAKEEAEVGETKDLPDEKAAEKVTETEAEEKIDIPDEKAAEKMTETEAEETLDLSEEKSTHKVHLATLLVPASIIVAGALAYSIQNDSLALPDTVANLFSK